MEVSDIGLCRTERTAKVEFEFCTRRSVLFTHRQSHAQSHTLACNVSLLCCQHSCMSTTLAVIVILLVVLAVWEVMASILATFSFP